MILHLTDWARYPTAIVDIRTKNKSFLTLAEKYRQMGVQNYYFLLALHDPRLQGVDPHSPDLTVEQQKMIIAECMANPWYYFREVARSPARSGAEPGMFEASRGNIALYWLFFNHITLILIMPRQLGKSFGIYSLVNYLVMIKCRNERFSALTKDNELRMDAIDLLKALRGLLPPYLNATTKEDSNNKTDFGCVRWSNILRMVVGRNSIEGANNTGRGLTAAVELIDEGPFIPFMDLIVPAMLTASNKAVEIAKSVGSPYGVIFTTTAGKKDSRSGSYMYNMISTGMPMTEFIFDAGSMERAQRIVEKATGDNMPIVNCTYSHRQLGISDEELVRKMRATNSKGEEAARDYLNHWSSGGLSSPLPPKLNDLIRASEIEPSWVEFTEDLYTVRWYIPKGSIAGYMASSKTALAVDTSEAVGRDACSLVLQDVETLEVIMAAAISEANLFKLADFIANFLIRYQNVTVIPERRSTGQHLIDTLIVKLASAGIDPFKRIFNTIVDESETREEEYMELNSNFSRRSQGYYDSKKRFVGFATSSGGRYTREALYQDGLLMAAKQSGRFIRDKQLIGEITGLEIKNGRIDHGSGKHDDMVIGWLLNYWFLTQGRNLKHYGITKPLSRVIEFRDDGKSITDFDPYEEMLRKEQAKFREEIETLLETLRGCRDEGLSLKIEARIRQLDSKLTEEYKTNTTINDVLHEARAERARQSREVNRTRTLVAPSNGYNIGMRWRR